jgi:hypothetical protein
MKRGGGFLFRIAAILAVQLGVAPALAACPIELAVYRDLDGAASLDFRPTGESAAVTNTFRLVNDRIVLDGIVMWSEGVARPNGMLGYRCPLGDATGQELNECTVWQGVIYTSDDAGNIGLLPAEGAPAPKTLILSDLGHALRFSAAYGAHGFDKIPVDVFTISGCQE